MTNRLQVLKKKATEFLEQSSQGAQVSRELTPSLLRDFEDRYEEWHKRKTGGRTVFSEPFEKCIKNYLEKKLLGLVNVERQYPCTINDVKFILDIAIFPLSDKTKPKSFLSCKITVDPLAYRESFATVYLLKRWKPTEYKNDRFYIVGTHHSSKKDDLVRLGEMDDFVRLKAFYLWNEPFFDKLLTELKQLYRKI